jgi:hypothetical protein
MRAWFVDGSDPGLCVAENVPAEVIEFGRRCQRELVDQQTARALAAKHGIHLEGLGGTEGGIIGALAAAGLAVTEDDGRVIQIGTFPDDRWGLESISALGELGVEVRCLETGHRLTEGVVDVGKVRLP